MLARQGLSNDRKERLRAFIELPGPKRRFTASIAIPWFRTWRFFTARPLRCRFWRRIDREFVP